jgi:hypothetical protein
LNEKLRNIHVSTEGNRKMEKMDIKNTYKLPDWNPKGTIKSH